MNIKTFYCNPYQECTYVVLYGDTCFIVDPGMYTAHEEQTVSLYLLDQHWKPDFILITHRHTDHVCGVDWLLERYPSIQIIDSQDIGKPMPALLHDMTIIPTPGHKEDAVCFYFEQEHTLFSGDTLFRESIGRTDLKGGDFAQIAKSLATLQQLPDNTIVYPGHGDPTTIKHEKTYNPYL